MLRQNVPVVRFELKGGGCGGLMMSSWDTELHYEPAQGDITWSLGEERVFVVDSFTAEFIDGGTINYDLHIFHACVPCVSAWQRIVWVW